MRKSLQPNCLSKSQMMITLSNGVDCWGTSRHNWSSSARPSVTPHPTRSTEAPHDGSMQLQFLRLQLQLQLQWWQHAITIFTITTTIAITLVAACNYNFSSGPISEETIELFFFEPESYGIVPLKSISFLLNNIPPSSCEEFWHFRQIRMTPNIWSHLLMTQVVNIWGHLDDHIDIDWCLLMRTDTPCGWWCLPQLHLYCPWSPDALPAALTQYARPTRHAFVNNQILEKRWFCLSCLSDFEVVRHRQGSGVKHIWKTGGWFYFTPSSRNILGFTRWRAQIADGAPQPVLTTPGFVCGW